MQLSDYINYNGKLYFSDEKIISASNRSFRYGDGFFETMKLIDGNIIFQDLHFERLFSSLRVMQFEKPDFFTKDYLLHQIKLLVKKNNQPHLCRIRITIFRGDGGLYDVENNQPNYIIQSWLLQTFPYYNKQGLILDIYTQSRKTADAFSHIKSNNCLPYLMAVLWSKKNHFDDALLMNCYNRISEATTSNIFVVKEGTINTPALTEGCIAGVTRQYLLDCMKKENLKHQETQVTIDDVTQADEIFLTNAGWHIQWIKQCSHKLYINDTSEYLYETFITPLLKSK